MGNAFLSKDIGARMRKVWYECYEGKTVHRLARENHVSDLKMYLELCRASNYQGRVNMSPYTTDEILHEFERSLSAI